MPTISQLKPWKAFVTGELSREDLFACLRAAKVGYTRWAEDLLHATHFPPYQSRRQVNFGRLELEELDLGPGHTTEDARGRLAAMGIEPELFLPVFGFELALACVHEQRMGTLVIPLPRFSQHTAMYVNSPGAGFRCSVRADRYPSKLEKGDRIAFVIPE